MTILELHLAKYIAFSYWIESWLVFVVCASIVINAALFSPILGALCSIIRP